MKSHTFARGVALVGALTLCPAATALAAGTHTVSHAASAAGPRASQSAAAQAAQTAALSSAESTPVHLGGSVTTHAASSGSSGIVRTIVGLFVVIVVIYGIAWILRQVKNGKTRPSGQGLSQVASLPLGSGRSVTVVRAGREVIVVGVAENGVTPIRTYTEAEALALGIDVPPEQPSVSDPAERPRFLDALRRMTVRS